MTVEPRCYVCGKEEPCINGLCSDCTMKELFNPGAAFASTFGSLATEPPSVDVTKEPDEGCSDDEGELK